ncbi:protein of unknown function DUF445 [Thermosinus carboxydivorans Nor1]|uniref:DUF445 domain-containing protein n=1 Tax=Thermosinus carboxydivorans Nor1 TaxID=401526 RepID=A1HU82_9FIRM|nr:DUF445 domain-containing protein [Thermosinus carboxydivorans]EAX46424.1 protein of unknown function DUF445 [Thermosinus carboxydivorans Nor1]
MDGRKHKANFVLGIVTLGFFAGFPFRHTFFGGLITSACEAAMVGGLADWFAVTALFRRPLGIPFRTELIPRNREKIFRAIRDMVEQDLITAENVKATLDDYDLAAVLCKYLDEHGGRESIRAIARRLTADVIAKLDASQLARAAELLLKTEVVRIEVAPLLAEAIEWALAHGYGDAVACFLLDEGIRLAKQETVPWFIANLLLEVRHAYERGSRRRKFFHRALERMARLSPLRFGLSGQRRLIALLERMKDPKHPLRQELATWLRRLAERLRTDADLRRQVETWKMAYVVEPLDVRKTLAQYLDGFRRTGSAKTDEWQEALAGWVVTWLDGFLANPQLAAAVDRRLKQAIVEWLEVNHREIGDLVAGELNRFSTGELVAFIEDRVGDDLQVIRINGSLVGSVIGMLIYLLTFWVG